MGLCLRENVSQEISRKEGSRVSVSRGYMFRVFVLSSIVTNTKNNKGRIGLHSNVLCAIG